MSIAALALLLALAASIVPLSTLLLYLASLRRRPCTLQSIRRGDYVVVVAAREEPLELLSELGEAIAALDPPPRMVILAWDGGGFEEALEALAAPLRRVGVEVRGFVAGCSDKACALNKALELAPRGHHLLVIDVDDRPGDSGYGGRSTACDSVVPYWRPRRKPGGGVVGGYAALLAFGSRVLYASRCRLGSPVLYLGSGSSVLVDLARRLGGYPSEVLEDLAFGLKLLSSGAKVCFGENHVLLIGLPPSYDAICKQQCRWARGAAMLLRKLGEYGGGWWDALYLSQYLLGSLSYPLLVVAPLAWSSPLARLAVLIWAASLAASGAAMLHHLAREERLSLRDAVSAATWASILSLALTPRLLLCSLQGLLGFGGFTKTPKVGGGGVGLVEVAAAALAALVLLYSAARGFWVAALLPAAYLAAVARVAAS